MKTLDLLPKQALPALALIAASAPAWADMPDVGDCPELMMVSGYFSDNVHLYNACSGEFLGLLDDSGELAGPQTIRQGEDGAVYVTSEKNGAILRYDASTLTFTDRFTQSAIANPTGFDFGSDGHLYVGSFDQDRILRFDGQSGEFIDQFVGGVSGVDSGLGFGPSGRLYSPNFSSDDISVFSADGALVRTIGDVANPRVIQFEGSELLVSSSASDRIVRMNLDGGNRRTVAEIAGATGFARRYDGQLFAVGDRSNRIYAVDEGAGTADEIFALGGGLIGATYIYFLTVEDAPPEEPPAPDSVSQFWMVGVGSIDGDTLLLERDAFNYTQGGQFGDAFDAATISRHGWGEVVIQLSDCNGAEMVYDSEGAAAMGQGGYSLQRLAGNVVSEACENDGFSSPPQASWFTGTWYGGAERSGEGFFIDVLSDSQAVVAWFTYERGD